MAFDEDFVNSYSQGSAGAFMINGQKQSIMLLLMDGPYSNNMYGLVIDAEYYSQF